MKNKNDITILLAEDDDHISRLVEYILMTKGFVVVAVKNGQDAIDMISSRSFSLVILDIMMPVKDGFSVLRFIRESDKYNHLPVLMLTAKGQQKDMASAARFGATKYLTKPFDPDELVDTVNDILG